MQSTQKGNELNNSISNVSELREKFYYPGRLPRPPSLWPRAKKANRPEIYCVSPEWAMNGRERATTFLLFFFTKTYSNGCSSGFFFPQNSARPKHGRLIFLRLFIARGGPQEVG